MRISVVTVCYNSASTIEDTIISVSSQSHQNVEYIIVDGGSDDGTVELIRRHADKVARYVSEPDNGIYDAMNKGIAMVSGDIIGFLNADDVYADNYALEKVVGVFADPSVDACYSNLVYVAPENLDKVIRYWESCDYKNGLFEKGWVPAHPTFFVRKSIYEKFGNFDLNYKLAADYELMTRFMVSHKIKTKYIPAVLVKMRLGGATNKSLANIFKQNHEIIKACKKNGINFSIANFFVPKFYFKLRQFFS